MKMPAASLSVKVALLALAALIMAGCPFPPRIYRINVEQGNILEEDNVQRIRLGMTKTEVQAILGTSLLPHLFRADRWDYYYSFFSGATGKRREKHLVLIFKKDRLVDKSYVADECDD